jgi:hypothetical protein
MINAKTVKVGDTLYNPVAVHRNEHSSIRIRSIYKEIAEFKVVAIMRYTVESEEDWREANFGPVISLFRWLVSKKSPSEGISLMLKRKENPERMVLCIILPDERFYDTFVEAEKQLFLKILALDTTSDPY